LLFGGGLPQGRSKVAAQPRGAGNFSGFLPKAATGQKNRSGGWQSAAIFWCRQTLRDMEFWRLSAESRYGAQDKDPDFRAALSLPGCSVEPAARNRRAAPTLQQPVFPVEED